MSFTSKSQDGSHVSGCFGGLNFKSLFNHGKKERAAKQIGSAREEATERGQKTPIRNETDEPIYFGQHSDFSFSPPSEWWLHDQGSDSLPPYSAQWSGTADTKSAAEHTIDQTLDALDFDLRQLSMRIHDHPEIAFQERFARDTLTEFMRAHGFKTTSRYLGLETAWRAEYTRGTGGRVIGINSEMDALSRIGHACGHNLIAASGCGIAVALKAALDAHDIPGKIILLGTPAEEGGGGKILLLERGGYAEMDFCVMSHPMPGPAHTFTIGSSTAAQSFEVEYSGKSAHAGAAPWEGVNALDAAFLAYSSLSVLRQQMKPTHRSHGIISGRDWISNVIPDNARLRWQVRAPTYDELSVLADRVRNCFEAAALATSCDITVAEEKPYCELKQDPVLARIFAQVVSSHYGQKLLKVSSSASTDFGNVGFYLPALHPGYTIPTEPNGGNHTPAFTKAAATCEAHTATMVSTRALALTALRVVQDDKVFQQMKSEFSQRSTN